MLVSLIIAALTAVYGLIFCNGTIFQLQNSDMYDAKTDVESLAGARDFFFATQGVSDTMLILGIVLILGVCLNYIMGSQSRRKYYVTNYVATGIIVVIQIVTAIVVIAMVVNCQGLLAKINLEEAKSIYESIYPVGSWKYSVWTMPLGYGLAGILVLNAVGFILNLVWKIKLMQGEKRLLESGAVKEVA